MIMNMMNDADSMNDRVGCIKKLSDDVKKGLSKVVFLCADYLCPDKDCEYLIKKEDSKS